MSPAAEPPALPRWWVGLWVLLPATLGAFSGAYRRTFDAWVHIFFADHYLRGWFETYEPRWYGGFSVLSYPPLAHQLVAQVGRLVGVETGFVVVMFGAMAALPFATRAFSRELVGARYDAWVLVLAALWPTSHRFAYVYGQLPTLLATVLALLAMAALCRFIDTGKGLELLQFAAWVGATASAHHVTTLFLATGCAVVGADRLFRSPQGRGRTLVRALIAAALAGAVLVFVLYPFLRFAGAAPQAEIPHVSRDPIWQRPFNLELVEQLVLVGTALVAFIVSALKARRYLGLSFGALVFGVLSLGLTTPLPQLLFRSQARWLTYDKFHHWAALWCVVLFALVAAKLPQKAAGVIVALLLPATLLNISHKQADSLQPEFVTDLKPLLTVLNGPDAHRYRHLTLGFGDQFCRLDIYGRSPSVDGDYHTARSDPMLRQSGVGTLDASKYYSNGREVLDDVLGRADALSLRWVFVNDGWYYEPLLAAGFEVRDVWENGVTLFEKPTVPPLPDAPAPEQRFGHQWGLVPISVFLVAAASLLIAWRLRLKATTAAA